MSDIDLTAASQGLGLQIAEEQIAQARAATTCEEKLASLLDAIDALVRHVRFQQELTDRINPSVGNIW